ncbi:MAG: M56 family metallopeptidase [Patescibacteria group bacterium]|nr:M56 family metallopeptidase [Patescibacteria group bacterium]
MRKINKNFLAFTSITAFLGISVVLLLYKLVPAFFTHTVYYCQLLINSYSIKIPHEFNLIIFVFLSLIIFVFLTKALVTFIKIRRMKKYLIKNEKIVEKVLILVEKVDLKNKVSIVKDKRPFAFCLGIRNPHIYISTKTVSIMTAGQLEAILLHEKYHLDHADSLTLFIGSLPELLFPFFPLIPKLLERYKIEREIRADRLAAKGLGTKKPIIEVLKRMLENPSVSPSFIPSIADTSTLEIRIKSLMNKTTTSPKIKKIDFLISIISLSFIVASIVTPVQATEIHAKNQDAVMVCLEDNRCIKQCEKNNMSHSYSPVR